MNKHVIFFILTMGLLSGEAVAGTMGPEVAVRDWRWLGTLSGGVAWARGGETQTFYLAPQIEKAYVANKTNNSLATGELFLGLQKALSDSWQIQLGLAGAAMGKAKLQGVIWDDADPVFNNYSYQYKVEHSHVAIRGNLLLDKGFWVQPWISGSIGVGFNKASSFSNTPLIYEALPNSNFTSHTQTALSYTLDAGLQRAVNNNWQLGVGYQFSDWGKSQLGRAQGQTLNSGLKLNHLYSQAVLINLTYLS